MTIATYTVRGMTCGHCVSAVTEGVQGISGVSNVTIELVEGGDSLVSVTCESALDVEAVRAAVDEAAYELVN